MALEIGTNPLRMDDIAARLAQELAELQDVRVQEPDTVVARCRREALKDVARRLKAHPEVGYETLNFVAGVDKVKHLESVYHVYSWKTNTYLELQGKIQQYSFVPQAPAAGNGNGRPDATGKES